MSRARLGGRPRSRTNRSRPQVVRHTRLDHGRAIVPVPLPQTFFSSPQGYRSLERVFTALSVSSSQTAKLFSQHGIKYVFGETFSAPLFEYDSPYQNVSPIAAEWRVVFNDCSLERFEKEFSILELSFG